MCVIHLFYLVQIDEQVRVTYGKSKKQVCLIWTIIIALVLILLGTVLAIYFVLKVQ